MLVLALDSAGAGCNACVWRDGKILAAAEERMERGQDRRLMPLVLDVMKQAKLDFAALDRIAVTRGPGSFTGLRIGLAAARGIGLAANKPVLGIDRFSIYYAAVKETGKNVLVVIDSRRKELFCRFYPAAGTPHEPIMMTAEEIAAFLREKAGTIVTGDVPVPCLSFHALQEKESVIGAQLAAVADPNDPAFLPRPLYLRAPDVTFSKANGDASAVTLSRFAGEGGAPRSGEGEGIRLEPVSLAHASLLAALHAASFAAAAWSTGQIEGSLALTTTRGWLARRKEEAVGFILCQMLPGQAEILTFCVRPKDQRQGLGEQLLQQAIDAARGDNSSLFLEVAADNTAAVALYEKLGFRKTGRRADYYKRDKVNADALIFELDTKALAS